MSSPPRSSRRGGGGGSLNRKTDASHLLNFRTAGPPPGAISSSAASSPQRRHHRRNNKAGGDRDRDKHDASLRAERRARRALSSAFYLHASSSHAFVLSHEARCRLRRQRGQDPKQRHNFGPDTGMKWDDVRMVEWLVETTATAGEGGSGCGARARAATEHSTPSSSPLSCPICLDDATSARMARCGHSFCYPCILRHLYTDGGDGTGSSGRDASSPVRKCPCCSEPVRLDDLRPVIFRSVAPPRINRVMRFRRLCRPRGKCVARVRRTGEGTDGSFAKESFEGAVSKREDDDDDYDSFPLVSDPSAPFCRYSHLDPGQEAYSQHLRSDLAALRDAERDAQSMGGVDATEAAFVRMASEAVGLELSAAKDEVEKATMEHRLRSGCPSQAGGSEDDDINRHRHHPCGDSKNPEGDEVADGDSSAVTQFYQAEDGQLCFLSSFNMLCLNAEYGGGKEGGDGGRCDTKRDASGDRVTRTDADSPNPSGTRSRGGKQKKRHKKKPQQGQQNLHSMSSALPECTTDPPSSPRATPYPAEEGDSDQICTGPNNATSSALEGGSPQRRQREAGEGNGELQGQEELLPDDQTQGDPAASSSSENAHRRQLPDVVEGQVVDVETVHLTADARKRYTFLSHLPLYVDVQLVEVHFGPKVLGEATRQRFKVEMDRRKKKRRGRAQAEKKRDLAAAKSARERELKERQGRAVDWNEDFFHSGTGSPPSSPLSDDFGPKLAGISGDGDGNSNRQPKVTAFRPNHPIATPPRADDAVFSFRAVCATNGVWPGLMDGTIAPSAAGSPVKSIVSTESTGAAKRPVVGGAWGSRGAHRSTTNSGNDRWKCAVSGVEETTLPRPTLPDGSLSSTAEKPRGKGSKGKGKQKVLLFSTGGHRGSYGYG